MHGVGIDVSAVVDMAESLVDVVELLVERLRSSLAFIREFRCTLVSVALSIRVRAIPIQAITI